MASGSYSKRNWRSACGAAKRFYIRDERGLIVASGNSLDVVVSAARAKRPTGTLYVREYGRDGRPVSEPVAAAA